MRSGYDVCIYSNDKWNIYVGFEEYQKNEAMSLTQQISNNYQSVALLWHDEMRVIYYADRQGKKLQPSYREIKTSIAKKAKKITNQNFQTTINLKKRKPQKASRFQSVAHKNATFTAITITLIGMAISILVPLFILQSSNIMKTVFALSGVVLSAIVAIIFYVILLKDNPQMKKNHNMKPKPVPVVETIDANLLDEVAKKLEASESEETDNLSDGPVDNEPSAEVIAEQEEQEQIRKRFDDEKELEEALEKKVAELKTLRELTDSISLSKDEALAFTFYCIGLTRAVAEKKKIPADSVNNIIPGALTHINIETSDTSDVIEHLTEYSMYPRYKTMMDTGYQDTLFEEDENQSANVIGLERALATWVQDSERMQTGDGDYRFKAVLFTDIVNFSGQTHDKGEKWMTNVLKAHNEIVRKVLTEYNGEDVKHTGDGILASFSMVKNAVEAAESILGSIAYFSKSLPDFAFEIRIGIASGEVILFEEDMYGDAVNLASRLTDTAENGTAYVSENTRNIASSKSVMFESKGLMDLKGIGETKVFQISNSTLNNEEMKVETDTDNVDQLGPSTEA